MKNPWRNLRKGLSKSQVKGILGSPSRIQSSVIFETWYYGSGFNGGTVDFDNSGRVDGWSEPRNSESLGLISGGVGNGLGTRSKSGASQGKWRNLRKGLSKSQVKGILGSPSRIQSSVIFETWYYGSGFNGGTVDFDNSGRVDGWSEPR